MSPFLKALSFSMLVISFSASQTFQKSDIIPLNSTERLELINVKVKVVSLKGKEGIRVEKEDLGDDNNFETLVLIKDSDFRNGTIELEIAGEPAPDAPQGSRGFVGVAFHIDTTNQGGYECIYLRPVNGRAENQLQRNHSVQYVSHPEYPWYRLRKEQPGVYESYADLVPGEWTNIKIVVSGQSAQLYVHGASQPTLIINDLKLGDRQGLTGLWLHTSTLAHYRNLRITRFE
jgi:hypothetical protein